MNITSSPEELEWPACELLAELAELEKELVAEDGEPMESAWHRACMTLLIQSLSDFLRHRDDFYVGGNMFIYFSTKQARNRDYRGPDFFFVNGGVTRQPQRDFWVSWQENGRLPDVIIELLSPTTANTDRTTKKALYEKTFRTRNYFCYDPGSGLLEGWEVVGGSYQPLTPNAEGRLFCAELGLWVGTWQGEFDGYHDTYLRFFTPEGDVVPTAEERQRQRADAAQQRVADLEAQLARLREQLGQQAPPNGPGAEPGS